MTRLLFLFLTVPALAQPVVPGGGGGGATSPGGSSGQLQYNNGGAFGGTSTGTGILTALGNNVGSAGAPVVFGGALGTPTSGVGTNLTGIPISTGLAGAGTGVLAALGNTLNATGGLVGYSGSLGTPTQGVLTNATGLPVSTGLTGLGTGVATALGTNVNGSGAITLTTSPSFVTPTLGAATGTSLSLASTGTASATVLNFGTAGTGYYGTATTLFAAVGGAAKFDYGSTLAGNWTFNAPMAVQGVMNINFGTVAVSNTDLMLANGGKVGITSGGATTGATPDTYFTRTSAGVLAIGTSAAPQFLTSSSHSIAKVTASGTAPGAAYGQVQVVCGTNAGSAKIIATAGTSTTAVVVADNIGTGVTGC